VPPRFRDATAVTARKYLVIANIAVFGALGDAFLARGMKQVGVIDVHHLANVLTVLLNPFIVIGIACLFAFMYSYMTALSFADLSYVMPATAISYVVMVLLSMLWLHEHVGMQRWAGVASIVVGVGFVAGSPARTHDAGVQVPGDSSNPEKHP
jgi:drug/metabolite transporter (DMT)-like permease